MLRSALLLITITIVAAVIGYSDFSASVVYVARIISFIALILFMLALVIDSRSINTHEDE